MPAVTVQRHGSFCWIELATTDVASARAFYMELFGWTAEDVPIAEGDVYTIFRLEGRDVAAMHSQTAGAPPNWLSYVAVESVDRTVAQATALGARVLSAPTDIFEFGRMAVLADDQDAVVAIWQAKQHIGVGVRDEVNAYCWNELHARDLEAARQFYPRLFGWRTRESDEYTEWHLGENAVGGLLLSNAPPDVPPFWLPYFAVDDCDAATAKAVSLGARTHMLCMDIDHVGRFSVLLDPQGAAFAVIKLMM